MVPNQNLCLHEENIYEPSFVKILISYHYFFLKLIVKIAITNNYEFIITTQNEFLFSPQF